LISHKRSSPLNNIVTCAAVQTVITRAAVKSIITFTAADNVIACIAANQVIAGIANESIIAVVAVPAVRAYYSSLFCSILGFVSFFFFLLPADGRSVRLKAERVATPEGERGALDPARVACTGCDNAFHTS